MLNDISTGCEFAFYVESEDGEEFEVEYLFDDFGHETLNPIEAVEFKAYGEDQLYNIVSGDTIVARYNF